MNPPILQARGHRFDPGHVHHIFNRLRAVRTRFGFICDVVCDVTFQSSYLAADMCLPGRPAHFSSRPNERESSD